MMNIGIITLPLNVNYGGILQNYALQKILKDMGHQVTTIEEEIEFYHKLPTRKKYFAYTYRILLRYIFQRKREIFFEKNENKRIKWAAKEIEPFTNKYITRKIYPSFQKIKETEYDAFVVGSDQIWRSSFLRNIETEYLSFARKWNVKRVAYAVSFGVSQWEYNKKQTKNCQKLIQLFNGVSVREKDGTVLCQKYLNQTAQHVLDPTLLLTKEDYIKIFTEDHTPKSKGNLLVYILDETPEKSEIINRMIQEKNLKPFTVNNPNALNHKVDMADRIQPCLQQWLRGFYDAEFVITDSFHACVFSIIFQKPFLAYGNAERGLSRFSSLLSLFHLEDRMILNANDFNKVQNKEINWEEVNFILKEKQKESIDFLKYHLGSNQ